MQRAVSLYVCLLPFILLYNALLPIIAQAEGVNFRTHYRYTNNRNKTQLKATGDTFDSEFNRFDQLYDLDISKTIYPNLRLNAGANFELNRLDSTTEEVSIRRTEKILRPFAELNLGNRFYNAGVAYRKRTREQSITNIADTRAEVDEITALLGMNPKKWFPRWDLRFSHIHTYDDPESVDNVDKLLTLDTNYTAWKALRLDYLFSYTEREDRLRNFATQQQVHFGKIGYARYFIDNRFSLNTNYKIRYSSLNIPGNATIESPLVRSAGLSSLDNTPEDGPALSLNNALINGNLITSAGLNIGTNGDQATLVNIGLDLGLPVDVDQIRIWVDQRLSTPVANSFSWSVYTSPDNTDLSTWTLAATVSPAQFGANDNRFEISFPVVNARFIKVVTSALSPTVPGSIDFPNIFVTEMQAFITLTGVEVVNKRSTTEQNLILGLRGRLTDKTSLGYNLFYTQRDEDPTDDKRTQLTNGLNFSHIFDKVFSVTASGQRTDTSDRNTDDTNYNFGAALKANWLKTFDQSLTYSGRYDNTDDGSSYRNAIFLRNNATLYRGWTAFVDTGYSWEKPPDQPQITSIIFKTGTNLVPNNKINFNLNYSLQRNEQSGLENRSSTRSEGEISAFYIPFRNLSLTARVSFLDRDGSSDTFQNFSVNWSPFRDGDLQLLFLYSETLRSEGEVRDTLVGPGLKWTIGRHIFLDMTYNLLRNDTNTQKSDSDILRGEFRLVF